MFYVGVVPRAYRRTCGLVRHDVGWVGGCACTWSSYQLIIMALGIPGQLAMMWRGGGGGVTYWVLTTIDNHGSAHSIIAKQGDA